MTKQEHIAKKIWQKPELRVICRGESEENVLASCKGIGSWLGNGIRLYAIRKIIL